MEEMVLTIRKAVESDVDEIVAMMKIFAQEMGDPSYQTDRDFLIKNGIERDDTFDIMVAASDELVAGYIITTPSYDPGAGAIGFYVEDFYVKTEMRSLGIGLVLIREAAKRVAQYGGNFMRWDVDLENLNAIEFYQKIGAQREPDNSLMNLSGEDFNHFIRTQ